MTPATRHGPISRRSRSTRRFRVTTCRARSPSSAGKRSRRSPATSGLRASARDGPSMPSSWPTRWASTRPTRRGSAPWPTSPARPARDSAAARGGDARPRFALRRQGVSRPRAGGRGGAAAPLAEEHRAMDRRRALVLIAAWSAAVAPAMVQAQREPVLKQVGVPHAYYWREMYVPQVTSGPSAVTWSPDGNELIYSMQGSLWRQRIGSRVAQQLTAGEGYDYQPDWSPDGRLVVFARYTHDAIEVQLLDLAAKTVQPVTANGAVNVEPRWSPDGTRIAFVSSAYNRRWHI